MTLGQRLEAVLQELADGLDAAARARVEGAIASIAWRAETVAAWLSLLARIGGPVDPDFVDWLAVDRVEGANMISACIATGSTRPDPLPRSC